jgi:hypothetical protein
MIGVGTYSLIPMLTMADEKGSETMSKATIGGESIRQITSGHQSRFILAVVCAASVMCVTSAQAQTKVTQSHQTAQEFPFGDENICTSPSSIVAGQGHFSQLLVSHSNGDFMISIKQNGTGTNFTIAEDTAPYQFNSSNTFRFRSSTTNWTFTTQLRKHMIRQGPLPSPLPSWLPEGKANYFVYDSVTMSPNSSPSRNSDKSRAGCK